jgi:hypothetical protein
MKLKNGTYNVLKFTTIVLLPAASTLYFALGALYHLPHVQQVVGTIAAVTAFLGTMLHVSSRQYSPPSNGELVIDKSDPAKDSYHLNIGTALNDLEKLNQLVLDVKQGPSITMGTTVP